MVHSSLEYLPGRQADNKFYNGPGIANGNYDAFASKPTTPYMKINMSKTVCCIFKNQMCVLVPQAVLGIYCRLVYTSGV